MSETPICDKHKYETDQGAEVVPLHIAIELECKLHEREREVGEANAKWLKLNDQLAEAQATAMELGEQKQILNKMIDHNERELADKDGQLAEARAEIERLERREYQLKKDNIESLDLLAADTALQNRLADQIEGKDKLLSIIGEIANNALYFNGSSDYEKALWEILAAAKPELFVECEMPKLEFISSEAAKKGN